MKTKHILFFVTLPVLALAGWTAIAAERTDSTSSGLENGAVVAENSPSSDRELSRKAEYMEMEGARIRSRLKVASGLSLPDEGCPDPVMEAFEAGLLIEVTLEEVEAAMAAAALTPDPDDDIEAKRMRHFGTYRVFCDVPEEIGEPDGRRPQINK